MLPVGKIMKALLSWNHGLNPTQHAEGGKVHHHEMLKAPPKNVTSGSKGSFSM